MGNPFHLLLETPEANLVVGMKWLLGTFSQGWNRARQRRGHVFQGRYKSVPVNGEETGAYYFRIVADYIHLNPARAGSTPFHPSPPPSTAPPSAHPKSKFLANNDMIIRHLG